MKLIVPFIIAATIVMVLVVLALRDESVPVTGSYEALPEAAAPVVPTRDEGTAPVSVDSEPVTPSEETEIEVVNNTELMELLREYGFGRLEEEWREWAKSRGYPAFDAGGGGYFYDQPYEQYDDDVLRGLADNGDMWAQQILAKRLSRTNPAEALELYRQAAIRGSVYAMTEMAALYGRIADTRREVEFKSQDLALEQVYAMRDSPVPPQVAGYAWTAVAELAGTEPMFGNIAATQFNRTLSDAEKEEGCEIARGMYEEIVEQRGDLGLDDFDRSPPPIVYWDPQASSSCRDDNSPGLDLSGCRQVRTDEEGEPNVIWLCAD